MDRVTIDTAFLSGRLGQALYSIQDQVYCLSLETEPRHATAAELREITAEGAEYLLFREQTVDSIQSELHRLVRQYNTLFLLISLLNPDLSLSTRIVAAKTTEELLLETEIAEFVSRRLLSVPLPPTTRSKRHEIVSAWTDFDALKTLLSELFELQPVLDELWAAWRKTTEAQSLDEGYRRALEAILIPSGFFLDAARSIALGDQRKFNSVIVHAATSGETPGELGGAQSLLVALRSELQVKFFAPAQRPVQRNLKLKRGEKDGSVPPRETDTITQLIYDYEATATRPRRYLGAFESKARVDKQISAIRDALFTGKNSIADKFLEDLLAFQLGQGDREHAGMSLCALTAIALDANQFEEAARLSRYAMNLVPDDRVVYTSRAEVFKRRGHFDAAVKAYQEAIDRFPGDRWALNGYADVLKEKGLFETALTSYRENQARFPDDPVPFNGEVGVLKSSGQRRQALSLAVKYARRFEYDAVTRATLGGCLASVGKYNEAIGQYWVAVGLNPSEVKTHVGYASALRENGNVDAALRHVDNFLRKSPDVPRMVLLKATLLRGAGRLQEADGLYRRLIDIYPTYGPARVGMAALRVLQQKSEEAREALPETGMESELDWFGFRLRALSYAADGDSQKAIPRLSHSLNHCPWLRERSKAETALGFVEIQRGNYNRSLALLGNKLEQLDAADQQIRVTFLAHAHAQRGAKDVATALLHRRFSGREPNLRIVRNAIAVEFGLRLPAVESWITDPAQIRAGELALAMAA